MISFNIDNPDLDKLNSELIQAGLSVSKKKSSNKVDWDVVFFYNKTHVNIWKRYDIHIPSFKNYIKLIGNTINIDTDGIKAQIELNATKKKEKQNNQNAAQFTTTLLKAMIEGQLTDAKIWFKECETFQINLICYSVRIDDFCSSISFNFKSTKDIGTADLNELKVKIDGVTMFFDDFIKHCIDYAEKRLPEYTPIQSVIDDCDEKINKKQCELIALDIECDKLRTELFELQRTINVELQKPLNCLISKLRKKAN